jgi:hypothetical protein
MTGIARAYAPWCTNASRISNTVVASRIRGMQEECPLPVDQIAPWQYLDIDTAPQKVQRGSLHPLRSTSDW